MRLADSLTRCRCVICLMGPPPTSHCSMWWCDTTLRTRARWARLIPIWFLTTSAPISANGASIFWNIYFQCPRRSRNGSSRFPTKTTTYRSGTTALKNRPRTGTKSIWMRSAQDLNWNVSWSGKESIHETMLTELTILVYEIKLGTIDNVDTADSEWKLRPYMNTAKKRQFLSV